MNFLETALNSMKAGILAFPTQEDKRPVYGFKWDASAEGPLPDVKTVKSYPWNQAKGIAYICGIKSSGLFCIDIDVKHDIHNKITADYSKSIPKELLSRLVIESTPSGGFHFLGFCAKSIRRSEKLAKEESGKEAIIETKGQGGYFVGYPSPGYLMRQGELTKLNEFTEDEFETLLVLAKELNRAKPKEVYEPKYSEFTGKKPGELYNESMSQEDFLAQIKADGWTECGRSGQKVYLRRPGKNRGSISATFNNPQNPGKLYVFSTSSGLPNEIGLTPYTYRVHKEFNGDFSACSKELFNQGFGEKPQKTTKNPIVETSFIGSLLASHEEYSKKHKGTLTGYDYIDMVTGGLYDELTILLAQPGAYKTTMLMNILDKTSRHNNGLAFFFSLEMGLHSTLKRYAQMVSGIPATDYYEQVRNNTAAWQEAKKKMSENKNLVICSDSRISVEQIKIALDKKQKETGKNISMVGVDYIDFVESSEKNDLDKIKSIMLGFKTFICKEMGIPVVLLCQTKRESSEEVHLRDGKGGTLIEATADYVIGIWSNEKEKSPRCKWLKHRDLVQGKMAYSYGNMQLGEGSRHYFIEDIHIESAFVAGANTEKNEKPKKYATANPGWWVD